MGKKKLPAARVTALRKFEEMLPVLLAEVAVHGVAHLRMVRSYEGDDQPVQVVLINETEKHLDANERFNPQHADQRMLREVRRG